MRKVFTRLLSGSSENNRVESRKGKSTESFGALLRLTNPRARLSRSSARARVFSPLGELLWYLSGSNGLDQILYYIEGYDSFSDDGKTLNGAYGHRIFSPQRATGEGAPGDQWQRIIDTLRDRPGSRNAIIQLYSNEDGEKKTNDVPCTCTLHFVIRKKRLSLHVHMRSNDSFLGMPHDFFSFTMLQEIAARELGVEIGTYHHSVASLHLYDDTDQLLSKTLAQRYLDEGLYETVPMPPMPAGDPWPAIRVLLDAERELRMGNLDYQTPGGLDAYWQDLVTLLRFHAIHKRGEHERAEQLFETITFNGYHLYVLDRIAKRREQKAIKDIFKQEEDHA